MLKAYINTKEPSRSSISGFDNYLTQEVPIKTTDTLPRKGQTVSGYGSQLPTKYMVYFNGRWRRVKCICYSNSGTLFIGEHYNQFLTVTIQEEG